jgi:hypothetical protein
LRERSKKARRLRDPTSFPSIKAGFEGSISLLFAAPALKSDAVVGAVLTGSRCGAWRSG